MASEPSGYWWWTLILQLLQDLVEISIFLREKSYLHSLMILKARTFNHSSSRCCQWWPRKDECFGFEHKLPWKYREGLLGQLSSVMKFVWLLLCFQAVSSGTLQTAAYALAKPTNLAALTFWHVPFLHTLCQVAWVEPAPSNLFFPMFPLRSRTLHSLLSLEAACPLGSWWFLLTMKDSPICNGHRRAFWKERAV